MHITPRIVRQIEAATAEHSRLVAAACRHAAERLALFNPDPLADAIDDALHAAAALEAALYRIISMSEESP